MRRRSGHRIFSLPLACRCVPEPGRLRENPSAAAGFQASTPLPPVLRPTCLFVSLPAAGGWQWFVVQARDCCGTPPCVTHRALRDLGTATSCACFLLTIFKVHKLIKNNLQMHFILGKPIQTPTCICHLHFFFNHSF